MCILESERLILRPPRPSDIESMAVWLSDYDVARMTARVPHPYSEDDAEDFLARPPDGRYVFVIARRQDGLFLGMTGLRPGDGYEFGYWLGKPFWGLGYATEAAYRLASFAFEELGQDSVHAGWFYDNPASGSVLAKLGARHNGSRMRDCKARGMAVLCHDMLLTRADFLRKQAA
ncbi:MAG TPA: GNAT family N-acetyltransferase [Rhizomicrobium sp.]|jgi:RimJ/RimL family protein N-acetyltransferase|nr:GNAT family N-acetyltransferase [Rhizomicrobium sp.]